MKFAAKRTWPDKSPTWEHHAEADDAQSFALEFATIEQLAVDTEFVVMARGTEVSEPFFFRVAGTAPYRLEPAQRRTGSATAVAEGAVEDTGQGNDVGQGDERPVTLPSMGPAISMLFYMGKVLFIATAAIALIALVIEYFR
ncbi:hypothetical protein [Thermochromatium tepidum]|uniref:Uncharacterized protein n=2 Tax=Thermochromatium tepidum TaxID=1050 RepID=A0A6I6EDC6_THETI|nr:hypothetical protein [Thermochromatium tepidum]QGU33366.1 hypothetical protein E6P07_10515 [Thermochromatium tepidum ATCC 43061]